MIHLESCIETLKKDINYNYVLTSPPDYNELGIPELIQMIGKNFYTVGFHY